MDGIIFDSWNGVEPVIDQGLKQSLQFIYLCLNNDCSRRAYECVVRDIRLALKEVENKDRDFVSYRARFRNPETDLTSIVITYLQIKLTKPLKQPPQLIFHQVTIDTYQDTLYNELLLRVILIICQKNSHQQTTLVLIKQTDLPYKTLETNHPSSNNSYNLIIKRVLHCCTYWINFIRPSIRTNKS